MYPVAFTNRANSSLVTSVRSSQKPSTYTRWIGRASSMDCIPPSGTPRGSRAPMENSPPGIQTMPSGVSLGGVAGLAAVGRNVASTGGDDGPAINVRERVSDQAPKARAIKMSDAAAVQPHRERRLLRCASFLVLLKDIPQSGCAGFPGGMLPRMKICHDSRGLQE